MRTATSAESAIEMIPVRPIREAALVGLGEYEESGRLFFVETHVDRALFKGLHDAAARLPASEQEARNLVDIELDIYNLTLVLRGLFNYGLGFNKLRSLFAPIGRSVTAAVLDDLRTAQALADAVGRVPNALLDDAESPVSPDRLEEALWGRLLRVANRTYYSVPVGVAPVVAFYYIKRVELRNLIKISEGLRHGDPPATIRSTLLGRPVAATAR
jgi:vacuolar-type H+-ATPase subunit C/Vma6